MSNKTKQDPAFTAAAAGAVVSVDRRVFLAGIAGATLLAAIDPAEALGQVGGDSVNLAKVALPSSSSTTSENKISTLNDGFAPANSQDKSHGAYEVRPDFGESAQRRQVPRWVQYDWSEPITINQVDLYWGVDAPRPNDPPGSSSTTRMVPPQSYRVLFWNGTGFVPASNAHGLGLAPDTFNTTSFDEVKTDKLRVEIIPEAEHSAGILEWRVYSAGPAPSLPPVVDAGIDRSLVMGGRTYLAGKAVWLQDDRENIARWMKDSGPGTVTFAQANAPVTTATFSSPGDYVLKLTGSGRREHTTSALRVHVEAAPPEQRLDVVYTRPYSIDSPLWNARAKTLIVDWIPHCIAYCERTDIAANMGDGGIDNFIEAGKANRGEPHGVHKGFVFSNAWIHQTVESMCIALMVDANGDQKIVDAQKHMSATLDRWIPIILAAQMPDGYLQTAYILADRKSWPERWSPEHRGNHEGYVSGYFIESAINHYTLTDGKDLRLYNAAKKLADCWVANIGPGKKEWFDGHQEMEQALVRFGRFVNDQEGNHCGDAYISLAKFLLDSRRGGAEYDQSHLPPGQQYEAVGHAVRATYFYSGMADIAAENRGP